MHNLPIQTHRVAVIAFLVITFGALSDCSNSSVAPLMRNAVSPERVTSAGYTWQPISYPAAADTEITGINSGGEVVGNYNSTHGSNSGWSSFSSTSPYTSLQSIIFPYNNAASTYLYAITDGSNPIEVGYVLTPNDETGKWAVVQNQGLWSITRRTVSEEGCPKPTWSHALLGINDYKTAVGYYTDSNDTKDTCSLKPYEVTPGDNNNSKMFSGVPSSWDNTEATGIASNNDIVGTTTLNAFTKPVSAGWFFAHGSGTSVAPTLLRCCSPTGSNPTTINGIALTAASPPNELIVGSYTSGSSTYGFVYNMTTNTWTYPLAAFQSTYTVINGVNSNGSICGWYLASGNYHGFVAFIGAGSPKRHKSRPPAPMARKL
jgi:hypothetical protein